MDYNTDNFLIWDMPLGQSGNCVSLCIPQNEHTLISKEKALDLTKAGLCGFSVVYKA